MTDLVLVNRLRQAYWPAWCSKFRLRDVLRADPVTRYVEEDDRACLSRARLRAYDLGRIRHFMNLLEAGSAIRPIRVDTEWTYRGIGAWPSGVCIDDGHHRYVAAVLTRQRRVPARFCGPVDLREWLVGERWRWPL